jgi:anti-anti-sigma factor
MLPEPNRRSARELIRGDAYDLFISKTKEYSHLLEPQSMVRAAKAPALGHHCERRSRRRSCQEGARHGAAIAAGNPVAGAEWCRNYCAERRTRPGNRSDPEREVGPLRGERVSTIILDLQDLTFIDSTGMHTFFEARNRAMSNGQRLLVRGASSTAQRYISIVGLQFLLDDPEHDLESPRG